MNNITNQVAFLRTSREFPEDLHQMSVESNKAYVDVANAVNSRTIGLYPANVSAITGNSFFLTNRRQQSLRQIYSFTSTTNIKLGFKLDNFSRVVFMSGTYTDGTNTYGLIPASTVSITGQISFYLLATSDPKSDEIAFVVDASPSTPTLTSGIIIIEWLSNI